MKKKKMIPREIKYLLYSKLSDLVKELDSIGIEKKDYEHITIELDYDSCYYEGDAPGIKVILDIKKIYV